MAEKKRKKKRRFSSIVRDIFPRKQDKIFEKIRKVVFLCSIVALIGCAVYYSGEVVSIVKENSNYSKMMKLKNNSDYDENDVPKEMLEKYKPYYAENNDFIGWIRLEDPEAEKPVIDYPVVQTTDNSYYVTHNFYGEEDRSGEVFADYRAEITRDFHPANIVLYAHNLYTGTYFAKLTRYKDVEFYKNHPIINFDSLYEEGMYKIFAAMFTNTLEKNGEVFKYTAKQNFKNRTDFNEYMAEVLDRSYIYTDVDVEYGDEILTLSTCWFQFSKEDGRFVVFARKLRDGEAAEVDVNKAVQNESPKFFDQYYRVMGGKWAGRAWDSSLIKNFDTVN